jgi:hypothetical protein
MPEAPNSGRKSGGGARRLIGISSLAWFRVETKPSRVLKPIIENPSTILRNGFTTPPSPSPSQALPAHPVIRGRSRNDSTPSSSIAEIDKYTKVQHSTGIKHPKHLLLPLNRAYLTVQPYNQSQSLRPPAPRRLAVIRERQPIPAPITPVPSPSWLRRTPVS